jgi:hypothetical protein
MWPQVIRRLRTHAVDCLVGMMDEERRSTIVRIKLGILLQEVWNVVSTYTL